MRNLCFIHELLLMADRSSVFRDMGSGFREKRESFDPTDLLWWLFAVALIAAAFVAVATILARQDKRRLFNSPRALFNALCKAHGLDRASRSLLRQLASAQQLSVPARLFLEPQRFETAMIAPKLRPYSGAITELKQRLFATGEQAATQRVPGSQQSV